jgi:hypothetical protein
MLILVSVLVNRVGVPGIPGKVAAIAEKTPEASLFPTTFTAVTLN